MTGSPWYIAISHIGPPTAAVGDHKYRHLQLAPVSDIIILYSLGIVFYASAISTLETA